MQKLFRLTLLTKYAISKYSDYCNDTFRNNSLLPWRGCSTLGELEHIFPLVFQKKRKRDSRMGRKKQNRFGFLIGGRKKEEEEKTKKQMKKQMQATQ